MPYIEEKNRTKYNSYINQLANMIQRIYKYRRSGHLNYIITKLLLLNRPINYEDYNTLIGILESVKLELYRRAIAPYEDEKLATQGDVY